MNNVHTYLLHYIVLTHTKTRKYKRIKIVHVLSSLAAAWHEEVEHFINPSSGLHWWKTQSHIQSHMRTQRYCIILWCWWRASLPTSTPISVRCILCVTRSIQSNARKNRVYRRVGARLPWFYEFYYSAHTIDLCGVNAQVSHHNRSNANKSTPTRAEGIRDGVPHIT